MLIARPRIRSIRCCRTPSGELSQRSRRGHQPPKTIRPIAHRAPGVRFGGEDLWLAVGYPSLPHPFALFDGKAEHTSVVRIIHEILYGVHSRSFGSQARVATYGAAR